MDPTNTNTKTLSSAAVYASLQSLNSSTDIDDAAAFATTTTKRLPQHYENSKSSSRLLSFYADMSTTYHRTAPRLDGKNTSARPLGMNDISARLSQRAITFTSKFYNKNSENATVKKKKKKKRNLDQVSTATVLSSFNISTSQMKRKRQNLIQRVNFKSKHNEDDDNKTQIEQCNLEFILQLNQEWNTYIRDLLQLENNINFCPTTSLDEETDGNKNDSKSKKHLRNVHQNITTLQNNNCIEWVGAYVRISHRNQISNNSEFISDNIIDTERREPEHRASKNAKHTTDTKRSTAMEGILISHSPNDWMIVPMIIKSKASDVTNNIGSNHDVSNINNDVNVGIKGAALNSSTVAASRDTNTTANNVWHSKNTNRQPETTDISLLPKVKVPKNPNVSESSIVVTARIPLGNYPYSFMINDKTQFLNIHLQGR